MPIQQWRKLSFTTVLLSLGNTGYEESECMKYEVTKRKDAAGYQNLSFPELLNVVFSVGFSPLLGAE